MTNECPVANARTMHPMACAAMKIAKAVDDPVEDDRANVPDDMGGGERDESCVADGVGWRVVFLWTGA